MVAPITASNGGRVCEREGGGGGGRGNWLQNVLKTRTADGKPSAIAIDPSLEPAPKSLQLQALLHLCTPPPPPPQQLLSHARSV